MNKQVRQQRSPASDRETQIIEEDDLKTFRTELPNLIHELRLTPYEFTLYSHLKRTAGAGAGGTCFKSTATLAEESGMSPGKVSEAKKGLQRTDRPGLRGKPLIRIQKDDSRPGRPRDVITIVNIWPENILFFGRQSSPQSSCGELQSSPQSSCGELQSSPQSSCGEPKNESESLKKEPREEEQQQPLLPPQLPFDEEPVREDQSAAAAEVSPVEERTEDLTPENISAEARDERRVLAHTLHTLGVKGADAERLVQHEPLDEIRRQIAWLPYNNATSPGFWLPIYIRDRWPKPPALVRQEAEAAKQKRRESSGTTAAQERQREKEARQSQEKRRREYRERLTPDEAAALLAEADAAAMAIPICRDTVRTHPKKKDAPSYRHMRDIERDKIVDARLKAMTLEASGSAGALALDESVADAGSPAVSLDVGLAQRKPSVDLLGSEAPLFDGDVQAGFGDAQLGGGLLDGQVHDGRIPKRLKEVKCST